MTPNTLHMWQDHDVVF